MPIDSSVVVHPPRTRFTGQTPSGTKGLKFEAKYGFVGVTAGDDGSLIIDGMNEAGLNAAVFYFPGYAEYPSVTPDNIKHGVSPAQLSTWILATCATVDDVKRTLNEVTVLPVFMELMKMVPDLHYKIQDANGKCIVIEPINGGLKVYDNPLRVLTNSPGFPWHLTHLDNFLNLSPAYPKERTIGKHTFSAFGLGGGLVGLPGDFTPPSRFVRVAIFSQNYPRPPDSEHAVAAMFHLLNNFDIPRGSNMPPLDTVESESDYTSWTVASDLAKLRIHWKTFGDPQLKMVDLKQALKMSKGKSKKLYLGPQKPDAIGKSIDVTTQLQ
jgi:choloylglycine hydrolase